MKQIQISPVIFPEMHKMISMRHGNVAFPPAYSKILGTKTSYEIVQSAEKFCEENRHYLKGGTIPSWKEHPVVRSIITSQPGWLAFVHVLAAAKAYSC